MKQPDVSSPAVIACTSRTSASRECGRATSFSRSCCLCSGPAQWAVTTGMPGQSRIAWPTSARCRTSSASIILRPSALAAAPTRSHKRAVELRAGCEHKSATREAAAAGVRPRPCSRTQQTVGRAVSPSRFRGNARAHIWAIAIARWDVDETESGRVDRRSDRPVTPPPDAECDRAQARPHPCGWLRERSRMAGFGGQQTVMGPSSLPGPMLVGVHAG